MKGHSTKSFFHFFGGAFRRINKNEHRGRQQRKPINYSSTKIKDHSRMSYNVARPYKDKKDDDDDDDDNDEVHHHRHTSQQEAGDENNNNDENVDEDDNDDGDVTAALLSSIPTSILVDTGRSHPDNRADSLLSIHPHHTFSGNPTKSEWEKRKSYNKRDSLFSYNADNDDDENDNNIDEDEKENDEDSDNGNDNKLTMMMKKKPNHGHGNDDDDDEPAIVLSLPHPWMVPIVSWLQQHAQILLMPILPVLWCILFISCMDRQSLQQSYAMPLLGIVSATLANSVPVGGGIVFVPILNLLGFIDMTEHLNLGVAFAVSTMTFGNGVFGFLSWLKKDPSAIAWHIVPYAVIPAWIGSTVTTLLPSTSVYKMTPEDCRALFAVFCVKVALIVGRGIHIAQQQRKRRRIQQLTKGGGDDAAPATNHRPFSIVLMDNDNDDNGNVSDDPENGHSNNDDTSKRIVWGREYIPQSVWEEQQRTQLRKKRLWTILCSFLAGYILVGNIGIGNAMTTFLVASFVWKVPSSQQAVVTGILCGGWTSIVPCLLHMFILQDVPISLWIMGLPGVYLGARIAPKVHERIGIETVLMAFCFFLLVTSLLII